MKRISELTDCISQISDGNHQASIPAWEAQDELGRLKAAVVAFRDALLEQNRLQQEARTATDLAKSQSEAAEMAASESQRNTKRLVAASTSVRKQSNDLLSISQDLTLRQEAQAELLEQIMRVVREVEDSASGNLTVSKRATEIVSLTTRLVDEGNALVEQVVEEVDKISDSGENVARYVAVIEEISFQTNLLALNASVEAARAGTAGKGFSIVAHEVRELSSRTADAAASIASLMSETTHSIASGHERVNLTRGHFQKIKSAIDDLRSSLDVVSQSSSSQTVSIKTASQVVAQFNSTFDETRQLAERCLATGTSLAEQSGKMEGGPSVQPAARAA